MKLFAGCVLLSLLWFIVGFIGAEALNSDLRTQLEDRLQFELGKSRGASDNLNACIAMFADASKIQDHCERQLTACIRGGR